MDGRQAPVAHRRYRRGRIRRYRSPRSAGDLYRQLLHGERRSVRRQRSPPAHISSPAAALAGLLQHAPDRHVAQHDYDRHPDNSGIRFVLDVEHPGRSADHRLHVGADVLAQLGLHPDRARGDAVPAPVCVALQEGSKEGDARSPQRTGRNRGGSAAGTGIHAGCEGIRPSGPGTGATARCQPGHGQCSPESAKHQGAVVSGGYGHGGDLHGSGAVAGRISDPWRSHDGRCPDRLSGVSE